MALPGDALIDPPIPAPMEFEKELKVTRRFDYEMGGIALNDPSEGHLYQEWNYFITRDLSQIWIMAEEVAPALLYEGFNITSVSGTFDQNMRPTYAYVEGGEAKLYWYDTAAEEAVVTNYGPNVFTPKVTLDDKRFFAQGFNDIIFGYVKNGHLYYRQQRDRFTIERLLKADVTESCGELHCIGMQVNKRLGFQMRAHENIRDWPENWGEPSEVQFLLLLESGDLLLLENDDGITTA